MGKFIEDYIYLCKVEKEFYKMHWKGVIVLNIVLAGGFLAAMHGYENHKEYKELKADKVAAEVEVW